MPLAVVRSLFHGSSASSRRRVWLACLRLTSRRLPTAVALCSALIAPTIVAVSLAGVKALPAAANVMCLDGAGTPADPFLVSSAADLLLVGSETDGCTLSASYRQTMNISLPEPASGIGNHVPIGTQNVPFTGIYDGGGFTISGLVLVTAANDWGLFGGVSAATIRNVHIVEGSVTGIHAHVSLLIGHAVGNSVVQVAQSSTTGSVTAGSFSGGLIGRAGSGTTLSSSFSAATIQGHQRVGGLIGGDPGVISDSYFIGSVSGSSEVGGLVGRRIVTVSNAYVAGSVVGGSNTGGLVGGAATSSVAGAFWDLQASGQAMSAGGGTGKSTAQLAEFATFSDTATDGLTTAWNITDGWVAYREGVAIWGMCPAANAGRPFLLWQFDTDPCSAPAEASFSSLAMSCEGPRAVGTKVTCTVTGGDAGIDILWRAAYNPVIAEAGVTLDASGSGVFSFTVPAGALGEELTVELVDWTAPMSLGTVGGPVPTSVPSGGGPVPVWTLGLLALAGGLALRRGSRPGRSALRAG